jgi:3-hydroxybutyrate dehydrogenase
MGSTAPLTGRTALVTGAGSGIGEAIAKELASAGAWVLVQDLRLETASAVADAIRAAGGEAGATGGDVSNPDDVAAMVDTLMATRGRFDILVNNAGFQHIAPIESFPLEMWNNLLGVLLTGPFLLTQAAVPIMRRRGWGRIINMSSVNGKQGDRGKVAYCSAKHGLIGLTRTTALETAAEGITVNAICPGAVDTPLLRNQLDDLAAVRGVSSDDALDTLFLGRIPQHRLIEPSEIAAMARFLASDEARGITGQSINVSAGWLMH